MRTIKSIETELKSLGFVESSKYDEFSSYDEQHNMFEYFIDHYGPIGSDMIFERLRFCLVVKCMYRFQYVDGVFSHWISSNDIMGYWELIEDEIDLPTMLVLYK